MATVEGASAVQLLIDQSKLSNALQVVGRIVPKRPVAPVVSSVLITASGNAVRLRATDLQSFADISLPAEVHVPGEIAVNSRFFARIVATLTHPEVALSVSGSKESLRITSGAASFRLRTLDPSDFPTRDAPEAWDVVVARDTLLDLVTRTTFCALDSDEISPFAGVMIAAGREQITMAATDSYQLAHYRMPAETLAATGEDKTPAQTKTDALSAVVPTNALNASTRALRSLGDGSVRLAWHDRFVWFQSAGVTWLTRCLDLKYPDLSRFIGPLAGIRVEAEREKLLEAVRQVASIADEAQALGLRLDGDRLHVFASSQEVGEAQAVIQLGAELPPRQVWLDARRLTNALKAQPGNQIAVYVSEPLAPVAIIPADSDDSYRTVLMPLRHYIPDSDAI